MLCYYVNFDYRAVVTSGRQAPCISMTTQYLAGTIIIYVVGPELTRHTWYLERRPFAARLEPVLITDCRATSACKHRLSTWSSEKRVQRTQRSYMTCHCWVYCVPPRANQFQELTVFLAITPFDRQHSTISIMRVVLLWGYLTHSICRRNIKIASDRCVSLVTLVFRSW